jgi:hypothetical protein
LAGWLGDLEPAADAWSHPNFDARGPERDYLVPDGKNDPGDAKGGHLRYALAISVNVDGYMTLLDPLAVDADGEWEAWDFGTKLPGRNASRRSPPCWRPTPGNGATRWRRTPRSRDDGPIHRHGRRSGRVTFSRCRRSSPCP